MGKPTICIGENKDEDTAKLISAFVYATQIDWDSTIPVLSKSKISSLYPSSVTVQPGLCLTWSETQIVGFLMHWLIYYYVRAYVRSKALKASLSHFNL